MADVPVQKRLVTIEEIGSSEIDQIAVNAALTGSFTTSQRLQNLKCDVEQRILTFGRPQFEGT